MHTERGLDRLVFFTDAVTAIAITLLILPLVDTVAGNVSKAATPEQFLAQNIGQIGTFVLSFAVISRFWMAHHALFEHVKSYTPQLMVANLFWAFTIVLLPLPTAVITQFTTDRVTLAFYMGTMTLTSAALSAMTVMLRRNPDLQSDGNPLSRKTYIGTIASTIEIALALAVAVVFPVLTFYPLLLLFAGVPVERWIVGHRARSHPGVRTKPETKSVE